ncbi:MAG: hypothetical protein LAO05_06885 [Acidobacteriia bacterium]|nr:hypothetical protein [Terriglobia bacterium]
MRRLVLALATWLAATIAAGETLKTLNLSRPAEGLTTVALKAGVGDIQIQADPGDQITVRVEVKSKDGFFSSDRQARREIESADIQAHVSGSELMLSLTPEHRDGGHWVEDWTVRLPAASGVSVKLGVGDTTVLDLTGDVRVEVGVGDVRIEGQYQSFGDLHAACGVGDVNLRTPSGHDEGSGFISHTLKAQGPGRALVRAHAGVGDVRIRLR